MSYTGWYYINEVWNLFDEGTLKQFHVDFIAVDEAAHGESFVVNHYDRSGSLITSLHLDEDDINPVLEDLETTNRPFHL